MASLTQSRTGYVPLFIVLGAMAAACSFLYPGSKYNDGTPAPGADDSLFDAGDPDADIPPSAVADGGPVTAPTCTDRAKNGEETDVDCGGNSCGKCRVSAHCSKPEDCISNICTSGSCVDPKCTDNAMTGSETAVDCGGPDCAPCDAGKACAKSSDCKSALCESSSPPASPPVCAIAPSCKELKAADRSLTDGVYTIDPDGAGGANAPFEVFCEMTTDDGGWTFFAHINQTYVAAKLFEADVGTYRTDRIDDETSYGRGGSIIPFLQHTHMMVTLDDAVPLSASGKKKILFYEYAIGHTAFNQGPVPCKGLTGFAFRTAMSGAYKATGATAACNGSNWFSFDANVGYLVSFSGLGGGYRGNHWGVVVGQPNSGTNTWGHDGYWYVR